MKLGLVALHILMFITAWSLTSFSKSIPQCTSFYSSNAFAKVKDPYQILDLANGAAARDPQFVMHLSQVVEKWAGEIQENILFPHALTWSLQRVLKYPENHELLRPLYRRLIETFMGGKHQILTNVGFLSLVIEFVKVSKFSEETTQLTKAALQTLEEQEVRLSLFFSDVYKNLKDPAVKQLIVDHFLTTLFSKQRDILHFAYHNEVRQFRNIPIALATRERLDRLSIRVGAINCKEWELFGWMNDSKSISASGFGKAFKIVAEQTDAIHFEIGDLVKDKPAFKQAFERVAQMLKEHGDEYVLDYLADVYEKKGKTGYRPRLNKGQISITNLEFFWIVSNPKYFNKTHFYLNYKEMTSDEVGQMLAELVGR